MAHFARCGASVGLAWQVACTPAPSRQRRWDMWREASSKATQTLSYRDYQETAPPQDAVLQINKDVNRTGDTSTVSPQSLRRVLLAHAARNPRIGYTQGLNFVAAALLRARPPSAEEAEAFWLLCALTEAVLPDYYVPSLIGVRVDGLVIEALLLEHDSLFDLPTIFAEAGFELGVVTPHWFMLAFSQTLPREVSLRVWDLLFAQGSRVLLATALALLRCQAPRLREARCDFGTVYDLLRQPEASSISAAELLGALIGELHRLPAARVSALRHEHRPPTKSADDLLRHQHYRNLFRARGGAGCEQRMALV